MIVQFGDWTPDTADIGAGLVEASNVIPRTADSYGPVGALAVYSGALSARCQGAYSCLDSAGNVNLFAGDVSKLYRLVAGSTSWVDESVAGGYATPADGMWNGVQFGERVIMTNFVDPIQVYEIGTSTDFADLAAAAPKARYITVARNFVIVANTDDSTDGPQPQRVWWSALGDATDWPVPGTSDAASKQSDYQDLLGDGGWIQGIVGGLGTTDFAVFMERKIWRAQYIGSPAIFQFDAVEGARGTPAPGSIVQLGAIVFYLGEDGFYQFDGTNSTPIGFGKVDKTFFADVEQEYLYRITSAVDPINKIVAWSYPSVGSGGQPDKVIFYNWALGRWSDAAYTLEILTRSMSIGYSLEGLDAVSATLEALPFSLDSRVWTGGKLLLGGFDTSHRLNYFTGDPLEATIVTGESAGADGQRVHVQGARPLVDVTDGTLTISCGYRDNQTDAVSFTTPTTPARDGFCGTRIETRHVRWKMTIGAGATWSRAMGVDAVAMPTGRA